MNFKRGLKFTGVGVLATLAIAGLHLASQGALHRAMAAIASAVWGS